MTVSGSRSQFCGLEPALKKPSSVGYNQTEQIWLYQRALHQVRVSVTYVYVRDGVAVWNVFLTEGCCQKEKTNRQKLWCGGSEILFREFWLPWEFRPSDQWIPEEIFVPFVVIWGVCWGTISFDRFLHKAAGNSSPEFPRRCRWMRATWMVDPFPLIFLP